MNETSIINDGLTRMVISSETSWHEEQQFSGEIWMNILSFVPASEILHSIARVSKSFRELISPQPFWRLHCQNLLRDVLRRRKDQLNDGSAPKPYLENLELLTANQLQRVCVYLDALTAFKGGDATPEAKDFPKSLLYGMRLVDFQAAEWNRDRSLNGRRVCLASSTDHNSEMLENVLKANVLKADQRSTLPAVLRNPIFPRSNLSWWSSRPSTPDTSDTILFTIDCPVAVLSCLKWQALIDPYIRRCVYTWQYAIVKAYRLPLGKLSTNAENDTAGFPCTIECSFDNDEDNHPAQFPNSFLRASREEGKALDRLLIGEFPVFESRPLPHPKIDYNFTTAQMKQEDIPWQEMQFPPVIPANVVTITLVGKDHEQFQGSGYYCCVHRVQLEGIPLTVRPAWL
jgi:hypothetical protein